ncbi:hypothetical protein RI129_009606 [Pyrocoelia pectoralis]|uniref:Major facilitator superfamily (MFS) profile domain-containing protein n=1 Tax=Pyrocoelia pectoralis TaxID=417401 RepID=A0AAN7VCU5_9COLE
MVIPARLKLYFMSLLVLTICSLNINVAYLTLPLMVKDYYHSDNHVNTNGICNVPKNKSTVLKNYEGTLEWSADIQYFFLTSPYISYIISQIFVGNVTHKFGTKCIVSYSIVTISLCNIIVSFASKIHYSFALVVQVIHGFGQGMITPALYRVIPQWIPIKERSKFMSCFQGSSIGSLVSQILSALLITYARWEYVYIISGLLGLTLNIAWRVTAYDKPELHPRITLDELTYIQENRNKTDDCNHRIPWISILSSLPLWAIVVSAFGRIWFSAVVSIYGSLYLKTINGLNAKMIAIFSGAIYLGNFLFALIFSCISDELLTREVISLLANRKLITAIGQVPSALLMAGVGYLGCSVPLVLTIWGLIQMLLSVCFVGAMVNIVDIAPAFSAPAMGFVQMVGMLPEVISMLVAKSYLQEGVSLGAWKEIFITTSIIGLGSYLFYFIFSSSDVSNVFYNSIIIVIPFIDTNMELR